MYFLQLIFMENGIVVMLYFWMNLNYPSSWRRLGDPAAAITDKAVHRYLQFSWWKNHIVACRQSVKAN